MQKVLSFQTFLRNNKNKMTTQYPFLSHEQIMCRLRLQWKRFKEEEKQVKSTNVPIQNVARKKIMRSHFSIEKYALFIDDFLKDDNSSNLKNDDKNRLTEKAIEFEKSESYNSQKKLKQTYSGNSSNVKHKVPQLLIQDSKIDDQCQIGILKCASQFQKSKQSLGKVSFSSQKNISNIDFEETDELEELHTENARNANFKKCNSLEGKKAISIDSPGKNKKTKRKQNKPAKTFKGKKPLQFEVKQSSYESDFGEFEGEHEIKNTANEFVELKPIHTDISNKQSGYSSHIAFEANENADGISEDICRMEIDDGNEDFYDYDEDNEEDAVLLVRSSDFPYHEGMNEHTNLNMDCIKKKMNLNVSINSPVIAKDSIKKQVQKREISEKLIAKSRRNNACTKRFEDLSTSTPLTEVKNPDISTRRRSERLSLQCSGSTKNLPSENENTRKLSTDLKKKQLRNTKRKDLVPVRNPKIVSDFLDEVSERESSRNTSQISDMEVSENENTRKLSTDLKKKQLRNTKCKDLIPVRDPKIVSDFLDEVSDRESSRNTSQISDMEESAFRRQNIIGRMFQEVPQSKRCDVTPAKRRLLASNNMKTPSNFHYLFDNQEIFL
ncbi:uncharacterized protein LOC131946280 isoform X2 [Physella acuta]|uniref:uncharacterized protein LOC131946280 isoform X2 n=1 Tax=Physella acuta TaxID=109671 RepID=UPI0027DB48B4|nr:uncharacterized protein LOC131946280 isoform X2 [Physella acuta]